MPVYENLPYVKPNALNKSKNSEEAQLFSVFHTKHVEPNESRAVIVPQVLYKQFNGTEYNGEDRGGLNLLNTAKKDFELNVEGKGGFLAPLDTNLRPLPLKAKSKGSRLRRKSKARESKFGKERECSATTYPKSKSFKLNSGESASTPINNAEKGQNACEQLANLNLENKINSGHSFMFVKTNAEQVK